MRPTLLPYLLSSPLRFSLKSTNTTATTATSCSSNDNCRLQKNFMIVQLLLLFPCQIFTNNESDDWKYKKAKNLILKLSILPSIIVVINILLLQFTCCSTMAFSVLPRTTRMKIGQPITSISRRHIRIRPSTSSLYAVGTCWGHHDKTYHFRIFSSPHDSHHHHPYGTAFPGTGTNQKLSSLTSTTFHATRSHDAMSSSSSKGSTSPQESLSSSNNSILSSKKDWNHPDDETSSTVSTTSITPQGGQLEYIPKSHPKREEIGIH
jgi:hypothetical protein